MQRPPIATHAAFTSIGIEIFHFKIIARFFVKEHESVGANTETAVAKAADLVGGQGAIFVFSIVSQDEVVTGTLVFVKMYCHGQKKGGLGSGFSYGSREFHAKIAKISKDAKVSRFLAANAAVFAAYAARNSEFKDYH